MILVDTSVFVAWMDPSHSMHAICKHALSSWAGKDQLAVSSVTYAELAAGARSQEGVDEDLQPFERLELTFEAGWRAGQRFRQYRPAKAESVVLPDFFHSRAGSGVEHSTPD